MKNIIEVKGLEKSYGQRKAVGGIDFAIHEGEIIGLLGPNGAGKSTTINMLAALLTPNAGEIKIMGFNMRSDKKEIKKNIGIIPQELALYEEIPAEQNVRFFGSLFGLSGNKLDQYTKEALELVALYDRRKDKPKTFSGGMKRRLNIACGIVHKPKIIIMDEPTVGIDPQSRNHILESIKKLRGQGVTLIYSTHYMEEVEAIADRVIVMNEGKIIARGTIEELTKKTDDQINYSFEIADSHPDLSSAIRQVKGVMGVKDETDAIKVKARHSSNNLNEIISVLLKNGCVLKGMTSQEASLETVFLELTGKSLRD